MEHGYEGLNLPPTEGQPDINQSIGTLFALQPHEFDPGKHLEEVRKIIKTLDPLLAPRRRTTFEIETFITLKSSIPKSIDYMVKQGEYGKDNIRWLNLKRYLGTDAQGLRLPYWVIIYNLKTLEPILIGRFDPKVKRKIGIGPIKVEQVTHLLTRAWQDPANHDKFQ